MGQYTIKEVETLAGVKAHTIRIWEQRYDFLKPQRTDTNIRYYSDEELRLLLNVASLNRHGMKISRIAKLNKREIDQEVLKAFESDTQTDGFQDAMVHSMLDFDESRFEKVLSSCILKLSFEQAFDQVIFPFLARTGVLWVAGSVRISQEHFISNLIRRKLSVAIDSIYGEQKENGCKVVLFLPEGELHELLLMYIDYLLRKNGHHVIYLGASLPVDELPFVTEIYKPDCFITYNMAQREELVFSTYLFKINALLPNCRIFYTGLKLNNHQDLPVNCRFISSSEELLSLI